MTTPSTIPADQFQNILYNMSLGERISSGDGEEYAFAWDITRVPSGWIYSCTAGMGHSVFVPYDNHFQQPY